MRGWGQEGEEGAAVEEASRERPGADDVSDGVMPPQSGDQENHPRAARRSITGEGVECERCALSQPHSG